MSQLVRLEGKHSTQNAHCAVGYSQQGILSIDAVQGGEGGHKEVYRYIENKNSILQWRRHDIDIGQGEGYK